MSKTRCRLHLSNGYVVSIAEDDYPEEGHSFSVAAWLPYDEQDMENWYMWEDGTKEYRGSRIDDLQQALLAVENQFKKT